MEGNRAALRYAKAILSLAQDKNVTEEVNRDMNLIAKTVASSEDLQSVLKSSSVNPNSKKEILREVFAGINGVTLGMFDVLTENKRLELLSLVSKNYNLLFNQLNNIQIAKVTTAVPLTPSLEAKIQAKVKELTGNEAQIQNLVDESILGGFILRVGDLQYNASLASQLRNLKRQFKNDAYISKI